MVDKYTAEVGVDTSDVQSELAKGMKAVDAFAAKIDLAATQMQRFQKASAEFRLPTVNTAMQMPKAADYGASTRAAVQNSGINGRGDLTQIKAMEDAYASYSKNIAVAAQSTREMKSAQDSAFASYAPNIRATQELANASRLNAAAQKDAYASYAPNIRASNDLAQAETQRARVFQQSSAAQSKYAAEAQRNGLSYGQNVTGSLNETRYALYDTAATWASLSAATLGAVVAIETVGIAYESAFAHVERTSGATGARLEELKKNLIDISTTSPIGVEDIAGIATLGGQLGIAESGLEDFTESVTKMGLTTNLTFEQAGTAFGRFRALLGTPEEEFENLGSSILKVGVNSVATETQIVNVATQISSLSSLAGLTADQTVGLAGALASVGAAPELSRGTITRVFSLMNQAVSEGTEELEGFARVAGISAQDFSAAWGTDAAAGVFQSFLRGLEADGQGAITTLNELGITSVRDVPLLLRLAGAGDVVTNAFSDAATGYAENTELSRQYGIISDTTTSMLIMLRDTIKGIASEMGDNQALKNMIQLVQNLADAALGFIRTPFGQGISTVGMAIATVVGLLAAYHAGLMLLKASAAGMIVAQNALSNSAMRSALSVTSLSKNMLTLALGTDRATAASARFAAVQNASGFGKMQAAATGSVAAIKGVGTALGGVARFVGPMAALTAAISAGSMIWNEYSESQKTALDRSQEFFGDLSGLMSAVQADSSAEYTGKVFQELTLDVVAGADAVAERANTLSQAAGIEQATQATVDDTTEAVRRQTAVIGENALAWLANSVASNTDMQAIWEEYGAAIESTGFELSKFLELSATDPTQGTAYLDNYRNSTESAIAGLRDANGEMHTWNDLTREQFDILAKQNGGFRQLQESLSGTGGLFGKLSSQLSLTAAATGESQNSMDDLATSYEDAGDAGAEAAKKLQDLANAVTGPVTDTYALADSLYSLGNSLYENGTAFDMFSEAGRANMGSLQGVISAAVASSNGDADVLAANLKAVMDNLISYGVDIANQVPSLLAMYRQVVGGANQALRAHSIVAAAIPGMGPVSAVLSVAANNMADLGKASIDTGKAMAGGFSGGAKKAAEAAKKSGSGAKGAAKEIRTLSDYVKDLSGVFSNAFEFRFGLDNATDKVAESFRALSKLKADAAKDVADAQKALSDAVAKVGDSIETLEDSRQKVSDLRVELQELAATLTGLQSDKNILQYQMGVAVEYGDTLRQGAIASEIQKINADIAKTQNDQAKSNTNLSRAHKDVTKAEQGIVDARGNVVTASGEVSVAQANMTRSLDGATEGSVEQRAAVLNLVQGYQGQITALANSGMSTDQLKTKTAELKKQFEDQLTQLGYNNTEIQKYSKSFDDMTTAINKIPRNITIGASTDPAQRAIDEFLAANKDGKGASSGVNVPVTSTFNDGGIAKASRAAAIQARISALLSQATALQIIPGQFPAIMALQGEIALLRNQLNSGGYASGGFTGRGGKFEPAGVVHRGEYVVPKHMVNQSTGLPFANALGALAKGYAGGGYVSAAPKVSMPSAMQVELSPTDRALLAAAGNVTVLVDGRVVANATNNANANSASRGSN